MFETRLKPVSNARRLKCNETRLDVFQTPTAKIILGTNIIIPKVRNGSPIMAFEDKNSSFKIVKQ